MSATNRQPSPVEIQTPPYFAFSVRDVKANTFSMPFFAPTKATGLRSFTDLARDDRAQVKRHPEDYQLYEIGLFHPDTGIMVSHDTPQFIANATEFSQQVI